MVIPKNDSLIKFAGTFIMNYNIFVNHLCTQCPQRQTFPLAGFNLFALGVGHGTKGKRMVVI